MSKSRPIPESSLSPLSSICWLALLLLLSTAPLAANETPSQVGLAPVECGDEERQSFVQAASDGTPPDELYAQFSYCSTTPGPVPSPIPGGKQVTNFNIFYERLNSCGYHPQADLVSCDVEIRRRTFYGPFPLGTNEYIKFCYDCNQDGIFDYSSLGAVHTSDDNSGTQPPWFLEAHSTTWPDLGINNNNNPPHTNIYPPFNPALPWSCIQNDGQAHNIRAILSWAVPPGGTCQNPQVVWGNMIDFQTRRDP